MARGIIDDYHIDDVRVRIEFDTGGPVGATTVVTVGQEDDWFVNRWFYFEEDVEPYVRNFARKVATDADYRARCLDRTAAWTRVADRYDQAARQILEYFRDAGVMGYRAGDDDAEREYRRAKDAMETICESLFDALHDEIRGEDDPEAVDAIATEHKDRAWGWLRGRGYLAEAELDDSR